MTLDDRLFRPFPVLIAMAALMAAGLVLAQLERADERGVAPLGGSGSYEVNKVHVDIAARDAEQARSAGWREAQRRGWKLLWSKVNRQPVESAPGLPDSTLDSISGGIIVEKEQIGSNRYIADLGVMFDRARAGELLGIKGAVQRSAPMLVIPIQWSGGTPISFERRSEWQKAWARFRTGSSPIDYVRVSGTGADPVLLNAAQTRRPGRGWWRMLLDQYGAADIIVPEVTLFRQWPGGPVIAKFVARHGPDAELIDQFTLTAENGEALPAMLDRGVDRIDAAYVRALRAGGLRADKSLIIEVPVEDVPVEEAAVAMSTVMVQLDTPDAASVGENENALRAMAGVTTVQRSSLALGGTSVYRVGFMGPPAAIREALAARGWKVEEVAGGVRIRRGGAQPAR